jgi:TetR/AcrR family transcriptional repressor of nem operon
VRDEREARPAGTTTRILDVAERLVQTRGHNGFSYADVATELGITRAALHYHYRGKAELGEALIARYADRFRTALVELDAEVLSRRRMCLCGMLAAEYTTLPPAMQRGVTAFFEHNAEWLRSVLERGRREGSVDFAGSAADSAAMVLGGLEGAMLITRMNGDVEGFRATAARILAGLSIGADRISA